MINSVAVTTPSSSASVKKRKKFPTFLAQDSSSAFDKAVMHFAAPFRAAGQTILENRKMPPEKAHVIYKFVQELSERKQSNGLAYGL